MGILIVTSLFDLYKMKQYIETFFARARLDFKRKLDDPIANKKIRTKNLIMYLQRYSILALDSKSE